MTNPNPNPTEEVYAHIDAHIGYIVLNRPDKRNALTPAMLDLALAHLHTLLTPPPTGQPACRAIILCGQGSVFCAGFDMQLVHNDPATLPALLTGLSKLVRALRRAPLPVIIAAHGGAVAGGCALLGGGDIIVTDRDAKLGYPVLKLGISPAVTIPALRQALTDGQTRERVLDTDLITGQHAFDLGLAHVCCDIREDVLPAAQRIAKHLASKPPHALAATKQLLNHLEGTDADEPFDRALTASLSLAGSPDQRARVAALWN